MKQILFPLKTNASTDSEKKWEAMDPLCFAEYIARLSAELQPLHNDATTSNSNKSNNTNTLAQRRGQKPLYINTEFLSLELPPTVPSPPSHQPTAIGSIPSNLASKIMKDNIQESPEPIISLPTATENPSHRKRPISDVLLLPTLVPNDEDVNDHCEINATSTPWDPHFLILHNPHDPTAAQHVTKELVNMAKHFESMPNCSDCISSYKRFQMELSQNSELLCKSQDSVQEKIRKFTQLYSNAILHMKALITMVQNLQHRVASYSTSITSTENDPIPNSNRKFSQSPTSTSNPKLYNKKKFTQVMNQWLVDNWTNPYPDDEGIAALADLNGTSSTIVSNWLINARTRKWRPAIVKAYETGRPADLLKEDSIRIFQRKPLRKL
jgi:Coprinus cinereus mating-type protein.